MKDLSNETLREINGGGVLLDLLNSLPTLIDIKVDDLIKVIVNKKQ